MTTAKDRLREKNALEVTFAKLYGEIDDHTFTPSFFETLRSCRLVNEEILQKETEWEKNR